MDHQIASSSPLFVPQGSPGPEDARASNNNMTLALKVPNVNSTDPPLPKPLVGSQQSTDHIISLSFDQTETRDQDAPMFTPNKDESPPHKRPRLAGECYATTDASTFIFSRDGFKSACGASGDNEEVDTTTLHLEEPESARDTEQDASSYASALEVSAFDGIEVDPYPQHQLPRAAQENSRFEASLAIIAQDYEPEHMKQTLEKQQQYRQPPNKQDDDRDRRDLQPCQNQKQAEDEMGFDFDPARQLQDEPRTAFELDLDVDDGLQQQRQRRPSYEASESSSTTHYSELEASPSPKERTKPRSFTPFLLRATRKKPSPPVSATLSNSHNKAYNNDSNTNTNSCTTNPKNQTQLAPNSNPPAPQSTQRRPPISMFKIDAPPRLAAALSHPANVQSVVELAIDDLDKLAHELKDEEDDACDREERLLELLEQAKEIRAETVEWRTRGIPVLKNRRTELEALRGLSLDELIFVEGWGDLVKPFSWGRAFRNMRTMKRHKRERGEYERQQQEKQQHQGGDMEMELRDG